MPIEEGYRAPSDLTDRESMQIIVALKYWTRATSYVGSPDEQAALKACDEKAAMLWKAGAAVGGIAGFGLASVGAKIPMMQRMAVSGAFASGGSFFGVFKSNSYCLNTILALNEQVHTFGDESERRDSVASPLAAQAHQILRDGPAATARNLKADMEADRFRHLEGGRSRIEGPSALRPSGIPPAQPLQQAEAPPTDRRIPDDFDHMESSSSSSSVVPVIAQPPTPPAASSGDSWEAVRARYRARQAGELAPEDAPPLNSWANDQPSAPRRRTNQYGDDMQ